MKERKLIRFSKRDLLEKSPNKIRDYDILKMHYSYYPKLTYQHLAKEFNLSRTRIQQIIWRQARRLILKEAIRSGWKLPETEC